MATKKSIDLLRDIKDKYLLYFESFSFTGKAKKSKATFNKTRTFNLISGNNVFI